MLPFFFIIFILGIKSRIIFLGLRGMIMAVRDHILKEQEKGVLGLG